MMNFPLRNIRSTNFHSTENDRGISLPVQVWIERSIVGFYFRNVLHFAKRKNDNLAVQFSNFNMCIEK